MEPTHAARLHWAPGRPGRLALQGITLDGGLRAAMDAINAGKEPVRTVRLVANGGALVLVDHRRRATAPGRMADDSDTARPTPLGNERIVELYALTPAEVRLLAEFTCRLDLHESAARLGISIHTARGQMKSSMNKVGVSRQPELMRKLLICATQIGHDGH